MCFLCVLIFNIGNLSTIQLKLKLWVDFIQDNPHIIEFIIAIPIYIYVLVQIMQFVEASCGPDDL
jgi:hypothetical protein